MNGIPITKIADGAFAGAETGGFVLLPNALQTVGANAFRNCTDLLVVGAYDNVVTESSSFNGCAALWFVLVDGQNVSGWSLPSGVGLYYDRMETGYGKLDIVNISDDGTLLTAKTDNGGTSNSYTVLLDVLPGTLSIDLDGVDRICSWALNNLDYGATVNLGENTLCPFELFSLPITWYAPDGAYSDQWLLSCVTAAQINAARTGGAPLMEPDLTLMEAAMARAEEYAQLRDVNTRPNGDSWMTLLTEMGFTSGWAGTSAGYEGEYLEA